MQKITIHPIDLALEKITKKEPCYMELHDDHLMIKIHFQAEQGIEIPDAEEWQENIKWESKVVNSTTYVKRSAITSIDFQWAPNAEAWGIYIIVMGVASGTGIYYKKEEEALSVVDTLLNWWLGK